MKTYFALHEIATQRGDGLKPELLRLLDRTRTTAQANSAALALTENVICIPADGAPQAAWLSAAYDAMCTKEK